MKLLPCPECSGEMESQMVCERCGHRESLVLSVAPESALESFERRADEFFADTGLMAPGKDVPAAVGGASNDELRWIAWRAWTKGCNRASAPNHARLRCAECVKLRDELRAALRGPQGER